MIQFFLVLPNIVRWVVLTASTVIILFPTWLALRFLWSSSEDVISIKPFVVVDPSGTLKNAEDGFAQILRAQMAEIESEILPAQTVLESAESGEILRTQIVLTATERGKADTTKESVLTYKLIESKKLTLTESVENWPKQLESEKIGLKYEGLDVSGIFTWIKHQISPERTGLAFTAHVATNGDITMAGNIGDLQIPNVKTIYLETNKSSSIDTLRQLAYLIFKKRLEVRHSEIKNLTLDDFMKLTRNLAETDIVTKSRSAEHTKKMTYGFECLL